MALGIPPFSYWPELRLNLEFELIKADLVKNGHAKEPTSEAYDVRKPLKSRFNHFINKHWLGKEDAFDLLEECLQPCRLKRIKAKDALATDFLGKRSFKLNEIVKAPVICQKNISEDTYITMGSQPAGGSVEYSNDIWYEPQLCDSTNQTPNEDEATEKLSSRFTHLRRILISHIKVSFSFTHCSL